jgi:hypothetical protein
MSDAPTTRTGGCECGAVRYALSGRLRDVVNCHCGQCRRTHGHVAAYTAVARRGLELTESRGLKWYRSSTAARRGFCGECGASLFFDPDDRGHVAVAAGTLDDASGLKTRGHIYVAGKGAYYEIADGLEQFPGDYPGKPAPLEA